MKIGVVFPQTEIEADAGAIGEYALAVERMGFISTHILAYDHVVGANTQSRPDWKGPYMLESRFQEYEALGANFEDRGKRYEEQIGILRSLWTNDAVTFKTEYHAITDAGINPMPMQRPIPLWMGGGTMRIKKGQPVPGRVLRRVACAEPNSTCIGWKRCAGLRPWILDGGEHEVSICTRTRPAAQMP